MAKHAEDKKIFFIFILLIILFLVVLGIIIYFYIIPYFSTTTNNNNNNNININTIIEQTSTTFKVFEDATHLHSDEFDLKVSSGISTINGKIFNTSNEVINDLNCLYTLKDINGNSVYEFTIYAKEIRPHDSFGFTSVVLLDLTNVNDYSVKLFYTK